MKMKKFFISIIVFLLSVSQASDFEKVGTTSFQFLKILTTARASAMAGAYSSIASGSDAVFWNPAGLTTVKNFNATIGYADWFMDVMHYSFSAAYTIEGVGNPLRPGGSVV